MTINAIIQSLDELLSIHLTLLNVSKRKTEIIKDGDPAELQNIILEEYKEIQKLEQAEAKRLQVVQAHFKQEGSSEEQTMSDIIDKIDDERKKEKLLDRMVKLTEKITELKSQEQLNQDLLKQSLKFVQLSLSAMNPSINQFNYGDKHKTQSGHSVFDSKA